jgi:hypothetical protein
MTSPADRTGGLSSRSVPASRRRPGICWPRIVAVRFVCAIGITGNQADAQRVVQDALWTVVRMIATSTGASASSSWLDSLAANVANADTG